MKARKKSKPAAAAKSDYVPTPKERAIIQKLKPRDDAASLTPSLKLEDKKLSFDHPVQAFGQALWQEALGSADADFAMGLLAQLANVLPKDFGSTETQINFMVSAVKSIRPRDQVEAMLAAQMAVIHASVVTLGRRLMNADNIPQQDSAERALNKLARTFAAQLEALKRYRSTNEQHVPVPLPGSSSSETRQGTEEDAAAHIPKDDGATQPTAATAAAVGAASGAQSQASHSNEASADETPRVVPLKRASGGR